MPRNCHCGSTSSGVRVVAGDGIIVSGSGTPIDPLIISVDSSGAQTFTVLDTPTVDMDLSGSGTGADPYELKANATVSMRTLTDVDDPAGPAIGDVPVFNGVAWEFAKVSVSAGAVAVAPGLTGDGSALTPLKINVADTTTTATTGLATYIDSAQKLRVVPQVIPTKIHWDDVTNKPTQYDDSKKVGGRTIYDGITVPTAAQGIDGDLYVKYT